MGAAAVNVTVRAFADLRELLGKESELSVPEGTTVGELLQILGVKRAAFCSRVLESDGSLRPYVNVLQNGRNIRSLAGLETGLSDGDVLALFPPIAGG